MTENQFREMLRRRLERRSQAQLARELGISPQYLCDILAGRREPGPAILNALGIRRVVTYTYRRGNGNAEADLQGSGTG